MASCAGNLRAAAALALCVAGTAAAPSTVAQSAISEAEQRLFLQGHLANLPDTGAVRYDYVKSGSLEPGFEDEVRLRVERSTAGTRTHVDYLSGERAFVLPDIESADGNPVILSFLERDVREMERRTGGRSNYFRKRVRIALAEDALVEPVTVDLNGQPADAVRISIRPYANDPLRGRLQMFAGKTYTFTIASRVPGMVYEMRTEVRDRQAPEAPPLVVERLIYRGVEP